MRILQYNKLRSVFIVLLLGVSWHFSHQISIFFELVYSQFDGDVQVT